MILSDKLIKDFAKQIIGETKNNTKQTTQVLGTVKTDGNKIFVKFDGSDFLTPVEYTVGYSEGDRVIVQLKDRTATIIGNYSDPSVSDSVVTVLNERVIVAENNLEDIETDISALDGRVRSAEGDISQVERTIGDPSDASSATGSLYARVNNVKDIGDRAITEIESEVTRAKAAEQKAETAANDAQSAANQAISNAANALSAANVAQSAAEAASVDAADAGRAASLAQSAAEAAQEEIDEHQDYFYHDSQGAHIVSGSNSNYRTDVASDGMSITEIATGKIVAFFRAAGATIGKALSNRFEVKSNKLEAYDSNNNKYFEVSSSGMMFGAFQAASTDDVDEVEVKANTAINTADAAKTNANEALDTANIASTNANNALNTANTAETKAQSVVDRADAGEFKGDTGDTGPQGPQGPKGDIGDSAVSISIESRNGLIFKDIIRTELEAIVNIGSTRITDQTSLEKYFGNSAVINWYNGNVLIHSGFILTNVESNTNISYTCRLEVNA